jgi:outer membrane protein OmpA-like peptidoglycan-associated protein
MNQTIKRENLDAAAQLAAQGKFDAALALLDALGGDKPVIEAYLLRAKIMAQQGRYEDAIRNWDSVLAVEPGNEEATRGRELARKLTGKRGGLFFLRANICYAVLVAAVVVLSVLLATNRSRGPGGGELPTLQALLDTQRANTQLARDINSNLIHLQKAIGVGSRIDFDSARGIVVSDTTLFHTLADAVDIAGIDTCHSDNCLSVRFVEGLFPSGSASIRPEMKEVLHELGKRLEPMVEHISIVIVGMSDDVPMKENASYQDNYSLSFARAVAVEEHLRMAAELPPELFSIHAFAGSKPLFPTDTSIGRARNRTTIIKLVPKDR